MTPTDPNFFCSDLCRAVGEKLTATATRVDVWLLLEYSRPWGADALPDSDLESHVKQHLNQHLGTIPNARFQFIKHESRTTAAYTFYVAIAHETVPKLYKFQLDSYDALCALDITAVAYSDPFYDSFRSSEALFAVCTNGKRDRACARYGLPVYDALTLHADDYISVWQTTHIGGHRFAGTMIYLPHGMCYGYLEPADVATLVEEQRNGRILLDRYRGRSSYDEVEQAAEYYLRAETDERDFATFRAMDTRQKSDDTWVVRFGSALGVHCVEVQRTMSDFEIYKSSADTEPTRVPQYQLVSVAVEN